MPDPHVISALDDKAHELRQANVSYEEHLDRTRHELAVVTATITLFQRDGHRLTDQRPAHVRNLFKHGEPLALCKAALAERGRPGIDRCGAHLPDLGGARPPDEPKAALKLRVTTTQKHV